MDDIKFFDNITEIACEDMKKHITSSSCVSIAAAFFSMYAYNVLREQLEDVKEFRFIYTAPTFTTDPGDKQKREFYIPKFDRESKLYGTEFEIKIRNEMTQKAIARECAEWVRQKARFKSNATTQNITPFMTISSDDETLVYSPVNEFSMAGIGCERGNYICNPITRMSSPAADRFLKMFNDIWNDKTRVQEVTDSVIEGFSSVYKENSPEFIYFMTLYNVFGEFLEDVSEDVLPNEATGFKQSKIWSMLFDFQKDGALAIINKLEKYNGCILADSVGLGKTFTALAVIKYYENRNKSVLVLCPKRLAENWKTYNNNYIHNPIGADRLNYDVLFHTDLTRSSGMSGGIELDRVNWGNYDLVVVDESHNFRNGAGTHSNTHENRYVKLMEKIIKPGVKTKVLMLSATPVNNHFTDLRNQLALAYEGDPENLNSKLNTKHSIDEIFKRAQKAFNAWSKDEDGDRTTDSLLKTLDFDFFELLDSVTIARSRKHIRKFYNTSEIGKFPERMKPISLRPCLTDLESAINYSEIYNELDRLNLFIYTPSDFIFPSKIEKYLELTHNKGDNLTQRGREQGILRLMKTNLLKRLESSVYSFRMTLIRIREYITGTISQIDRYLARGSHADIDLYEADENDLDMDDANTDFALGKKVKIDLEDVDCTTWRSALQNDADVLELLILMVEDITPQHDTKLKKLLELISKKIENPINGDNKKILIFSAFADTASYLYDNVSAFVSEKYGLDTALLTGTTDGRSTVKKLPATQNDILTSFSPVSKNRDILYKDKPKYDIDILIATDCISEGQNLQDCDYLVNYDIHWNPVRIIQRFGRIDRIGSTNDRIQLVNFWPDVDLDAYIDLKNRVETRMRISIMTSTGDDDLINPEEKGDLEYRRRQLKRLQEEVVDVEDMSDSISIMDLGLNEFRLDLLEFIKNHSDIRKKPRGLHAVVPAQEGLPRGTVFVLKNINDSVNRDNRNRIHPFYMVYIDENGDVACDYLNPKRMLDNLRVLCRGKREPVRELYTKFNEETKDGRDMSKQSQLLNSAIKSIISAKEESDIDSLFSGGGTSALISDIKGLDDFELICFLVVK